MKFRTGNSGNGSMWDSLFPVFNKFCGIDGDGGASGGGGAAAPAAGTGAGTGSGSSSGSAATGASPASAQSGSQPQGQQGGNSSSTNQGQGTGQGDGQQGQGDANLATLRTNYESYRKLGELDAVTARHTAFTKLHDTVQELGTKLNYTPESITQAMLDDPMGTLTTLSQEWAESQRQTQQNQGQQRPKDPAEVAREVVRKEIDPLMQHVQKQKVDAANTLFENEFVSQFNDHPLFKDKSDIPDDVRSVIKDMVSESLKYNEPALKALYNGSKTAEVKKTFDGVMERFQKVMNSYIQWTTKGNQGQQQGQQQRSQGNGAHTGAKPTLDDYINMTPVAEKSLHL